MMPKTHLDERRGRWMINTDLSRYIVDFERNEVNVWPSRSIAPSPLLQLGLVEMQQCRVGEPLMMKLESQNDHRIFDRKAATVTRLCKLFTQEDVDRERRWSDTG